MKKKIGFVDLFIDEWHANNYPAWFRSQPGSEKFELGYAWQAEQRDGLKSLTEWCQAFEMCPADSIEEVVEKSDAICILAPANPEVHERLAQIPLRSGKPVYIDKPFAPDGETAERIFALAEEYHTPLMSSSALRYGDELRNIRKEKFAAGNALSVSTTGGGRSFDEYGIHQLEMIVSTLGTGAERVMQLADGPVKHLAIGYGDGRTATASWHCDMPFTARISDAEKSVFVPDCSNMFENLIADMMTFFDTGVSPVPKAETLEIARILGVSLQALKTPGKWIDLK